MKQPPYASWFFLPVFVIALAGCAPAPRGQWIWEVDEQNDCRPSPQLLEKLQRKADFEFKNERLDCVFVKWHESFGVNFHVNWAALEAAARDPEAEVNLQFKCVSLTTALERLLDEIAGDETELGYEIENDVVIVSTLEDLSRRTIIRIYDVSDLIILGSKQRVVHDQGNQACFDYKPPDPSIKELRDAEVLGGIVQANVDPDSWREAGGAVATMDAYGPFLIVRQTSRAHQEIEALLSSLRAAMARR